MNLLWKTPTVTNPYIMYTVLFQNVLHSSLGWGRGSSSKNILHIFGCPRLKGLGYLMELRLVHKALWARMISKRCSAATKCCSFLAVKWFNAYSRIHILDGFIPTLNHLTMDLWSSHWMKYHSENLLVDLAFKLSPFESLGPLVILRVRRILRLPNWN